MSDISNIFKLIRTYWLASLILALAVISNIFFIWAISGAKSDFLSKNEELNSLSAKSSNILELRKKYEDIESIVNQIDGTFLDDSNVVDFIIFIENMARSTGNSVSIKSVSEENIGGSRAFRVELQGTFSSFVNFVAQLENSPQLAYPIRVDMKEYVNPETKTGALRSVLEIKALSI